MEKESILSYGLVNTRNTDETNYRFRNLTSLPERFKNPEGCKITCLTYRRDDDTEEVRKGLQHEIFEMGYRTKEELEKSRIRFQEEIQENKLKSWLNPFGKDKSRDKKIAAGGIIAAHVLPFVTIPSALFVGDPASTTLVALGGSLAFSDIIMGFVRRADTSREREKMKNIEEKFSSQENEYFCKLKEIAPKISVENVFVEDAHMLVENMKTFNLVELKSWWGTSKIEKDYNLVNAELNKIYKDYISQPKT